MARKADDRMLARVSRDGKFLLLNRRMVKTLAAASEYVAVRRTAEGMIEIHRLRLDPETVTVVKITSADGETGAPRISLGKASKGTRYRAGRRYLVCYQNYAHQIPKDECPLLAVTYIEN